MRPEVALMSPDKVERSAGGAGRRPGSTWQLLDLAAAIRSSFQQGNLRPNPSRCGRGHAREATASPRSSPLALG